VKPEPDIPNLEKALALAEAARPELVIGFGGGSAMDLAKLVAVLPGSGQGIHEVVGPEKVLGRRVALIQVPTTAGTGSEGGTRALVTDPSTRNKLAVQSRHMLADLAVVDPDLTLTVPAPVTAAAGRVLVVDDEREIAELVAETLGRDGYEVEAVTGGRAALARLARGGIDLVVTDLRMPDLDGAQLVAALRAAHPELASRLVLITGDVLGAQTGEAARAAGLPVLEKPLDLAALRREVRRLLDA
jgi:CheY-like chemotaxis protein